MNSYDFCTDPGAHDWLISCVLTFMLLPFWCIEPEGLSTLPASLASEISFISQLIIMTYDIFLNPLILKFSRVGIQDTLWNEHCGKCMGSMSLIPIPIMYANGLLSFGASASFEKNWMRGIQAKKQGKNFKIIS